MDRVLPTLLVAAVLLVVFGGMLLGWRARKRRQATFPDPRPTPADLGEPRSRQDLLYVATTRADAPLDRIAVAGLGFRARAQLTGYDAGLVLALAGGTTVFIPRADLRGVGRATWTIDRAVSRDGLVFLRWVLGGAEIDSYVRPADPAGLLEQVAPLVPASTGGTP